jgi:hypothetical protein
MASDRDIWRTAGHLIERHGAAAPLYALQSVDQLVERGDFRGAAQWRHVWRAAQELLRGGPASRAQLN